jgi:septum formation protein
MGPAGSRTLVLASSSPRRRELVSLLGIPFVIEVPDHPEEPEAEEPPETHVVRLAEEKARLADGRLPGGVVLGADTAVVLDGEIFGKPADIDDARRMLALLQGRTHRVLTGWALVDGAATLRGIEESRVTMRPQSPAQVEGYLATGEFRDKAGAYAAQGDGAAIIAAIEGSYSNVVGLPLTPVIEALKRAGFSPALPELGNLPGSPAVSPGMIL